MQELLSADSLAWGSQDLAETASAVVHHGAGKDDSASLKDAPISSKSAAGGAVIVVGAGPAGLLAAHLLARRHGCRVDLFDRRPHPGPIHSSADDDDRAFAVSMNSRGMEAVSAAGLDVGAFTSTPGTHMAEVKDTLLAKGDGLPQEGGARGATVVVPFGRSRVVGSRQAFVRALLHQIEQQETAAAAKATKAGGSKGSSDGQPGGGSITFHWGDGFVSADLAARSATFQLADGSTTSLKYDLLVGSDGYWSRVRRTAEQEVAEMEATCLPPNRQYKVVRGLPPQAALPLGPPAGSNGPGRLCMVQEADGVEKPPGSCFLSQPSEEAGVTAVLSMQHKRWEGLEGAQADAYRAMLAAGYPSLPESWAEEMATQMAQKPLFETGMQVHASQLHGPALVLLGDAAHAVSPATSNGMNSALEDSLVLSQVLEACDGDLSALPPRYTAARLEDARALLWLDSAMSALVGRGPQSAALKASVVARLLLHKASGGWVAQHGFVQFKDGTLPYAEARRQVERDMAAATVVTAGAGLALAAAAAVQAMRFGQR